MLQQEITDAADLQINGLLAGFRTAQDVYLASHGLYFQGLATHTICPADGATVAPDNLTSHPTYQSTCWPDLVQLPDTLPCSLAYDQYVEQAGSGWILRATVRIGGSTWQRAINHAPAGESDSGWVQLPPDLPPR